MEVKIIKCLMAVGFVFFSFGVLFGHFYALPLLFDTVLKWGMSDIEAMLNLKDFMLLAVKLYILLGLLFQLPNVLVILGFAEIVTYYSLKKMRSLIYVILSVASAMFTPPDPITMLLAFLPMVMLFELGLLAVRFIVHPSS